MENIRFYIIDKSEIHKIKSLWEGLNRHHYSLSPYFKAFYENFTFEKRIKKFSNSDIIVHLMVAEDITSRKLIGYCLSSIDGSHSGEIDSLYIDNTYRGQKIGEHLMNDACKWIQDNNIERINLSVVYGNEKAENFYKKLGFFPSSITYSKNTNK